MGTGHFVEAAQMSKSGVGTSGGQHPEHPGEAHSSHSRTGAVWGPRIRSAGGQTLWPPMSTGPGPLSWEVNSSFCLPVYPPSPLTTLDGGRGPQR